VFVQNVYAEIIIRDVDDFYQYLKKSEYYRNSLTFRGQMDSNWPLASDIERKMKPYLNERHIIGNYEEKKILEIQRRAHTLIKNGIPDSDDYLEWLALLQHHGAKTRLVDFSRSIFVACYFATRYDGKSGCDAAVWGVHLGKLERFKMYKLYKAFEISFDLPVYETDKLILKSSITQRKKVSGVSILHPFRQNQRLFAQQGEFLAPLNINKSFMENLSEVFLGECDTEVKNGYCDFEAPYKRGYIDEFSSDELVKYIGVVKFIIPEKFHRGLRVVLEHMNIQTESLFPDFEGAVQALNHDHYV
jgi:hypothetical protein